MKECDISGCNREVKARAMCSMHWQRWRRTQRNSFTSLIRIGESRKNHPLYDAYLHMIQRCENPKNTHYEYYGGRGIGVCNRWKGIDGFSNFTSDMGDRPVGMTLDRIDVNGDYAPSNCRWASAAQQGRNTRVYRNSKTGVPGVIYAKRDKIWRASITVNGAVLYLGSYKNIDEAISARKQAEIKYWDKLLLKGDS